MKATTLLLTLSAAATLFTSCSKDNSIDKPEIETKESYINATSKTTWHYFSLSGNKVVGTGEQTEADNKTWAARTDWDFAVNRYEIRTNSGEATSVKATGGVYTFGAAVTFASVNEVPANAAFAADKAVTSNGMGGAVTTVKSEASVIVFKKNDDGSMIMPPVYLQAPVYIFRTADGKGHYKVQFTQYQDENKVTGHVKFYSAFLQ